MNSKEATAKLYQGLELILEVFPSLLDQEKINYKRVYGDIYNAPEPYRVAELQEALEKTTSAIEEQINDLLED